MKSCVVRGATLPIITMQITQIGMDITQGVEGLS